PSGAAAEAYSSSGDRLDWTLANSGTYKVVVEPYTQGDVGTYNVTLLDLQGGALTSGTDTNGGPIAPGQTKSATMQTTPDFDAWQFYGTIGDTVTITAQTLTGTMNTNIALYPPYGNPILNGTTDVQSIPLPATGLYTLEIEDGGLNDTGTYQVT